MADSLKEAKVPKLEQDPNRPSKKVHKPEDLEKWLNSQAHHDFVAFILLVNDAVKGKKISDAKKSTSESVQKVLDILDTLKAWLKVFPPLDQPHQRFGNKAFRKWQEKLVETSESLLVDLVPEEHKEHIKEISTYLNGSFGNPTRIDYGTGHEARFATFLCALMKVRALKEDDAVDIALKIFVKYLDVARNVQVTYRQEPAGSHGVWGLDDYQFIPFIWGSAQLMGPDPPVKTNDFSDPQLARTFSDEYMFLACIKYINEVKKGPFFEHSNTLWGMTDVPEWSKINSGLIKMYKAEVLNKFPVIQHYLFGKVMSIAPASE